MTRIDKLEKRCDLATTGNHGVWLDHLPFRQLLAVARAAIAAPRTHAEWCWMVQGGGACDCWRREIDDALAPLLQEVPDAQS